MIARARSRVGALGRLPILSVRDLAWVGRAQWYLVRARVSLLLVPRGRLLAAVPEADAGRTPYGDALVQARRVALAVDRAAEYGLFVPTCLVRAIALERLLTREGVAGAVVRIGARHRGGRPEMHAWIEVGGIVIGERPEVAGAFTPLHDFTAVRRV